MIADGRVTSYSALERAARAAARRLAARGARPGDRIATTLPAGEDFAVLLHAVAKLGAVLAPLNTRLSAGELRAQLDAAGARLTVDEPLDGDQAELEPRAASGAATPWTLLFTSGTGGSPKPVLLTRRNHVSSALAIAWRLGVSPDDRWLCVLPLYHVGGLAILVRSVVYGTAAELHERFEPERAAASLADGEVTLASLVPTMLVRVARLGLDPSPAIRAVLVGGASTPAELRRWAAQRGISLVRTYGMTETASQVATASGAADGATPLPGVELRIGADDEILIRGSMVAPGEAAPDGWLHSGDRGRIDGDGLLHVLGRLDEVIISGGEKVAAGEVERALAEHAGVAEVAVVGAPDREWGQAVVACVVRRPGARVAAGDLVRHCRGRLAGFKVPKEVRFMSGLPRNAGGKVARALLQRELSGRGDT